jgi:PAS domain S-box-containing protein
VPNMISIISNIRRRRMAEAALKESRARFHTLVETAPALIFATDRQGRNSFVNERYQSYTGLSLQELCGDGWLSVIHPEDRTGAHSESADAQLTRRPLERRLRIRRHDGEWRWFLSRTEPVVDASEKSPFAWLGISIDINDQVHTEERERLLAREVDHRAKNVLAVVQSLVQLTQANNGVELKAAINGRIQALARSHSLLAASRWQAVELKRLVCEELAAFAAQVSVSGPDVRLVPSEAQSLGLIIHELVTNAAKYGALSQQEGRLQVCWTCIEQEGEQRVEVCWDECDGPAVKFPAKSGFGSTLIRTSVEKQLKGTLITEWRPEGLTCKLLFRAAAAPDIESEEARLQTTSQAGDVSCLCEQRVLIVEDEVLLGLQLVGTLQDAGCTVVGPAASVSEAIDLIVSTKPTAAILDVNLGTEESFPIADVLRAKNIPFVFCTGYAAASDLPKRLQTSEVLAKPFTPLLLLNALGRLLG